MFNYKNTQNTHTHIHTYTPEAQRSYRCNTHCNTHTQNTHTYTHIHMRRSAYITATHTATQTHRKKKKHTHTHTHMRRSAHIIERTKLQQQTKPLPTTRILSSGAEFGAKHSKFVLGNRANMTQHNRKHKIYDPTEE